MQGKPAVQSELQAKTCEYTNYYKLIDSGLHPVLLCLWPVSASPRWTCARTVACFLQGLSQSRSHLRDERKPCVSTERSLRQCISKVDMQWCGKSEY